MIAICREVDKNGGGIAVYPIESEVTERLLTCLTLRARLNPELRYFVTARVRWENESARKLIESSLRRKNVTANTVAAVGGACGAMSERPRYVAGCSFGKDSLATVLIAIEHGEPLDEAIYCEVMFNDEISGEVPEHRDFIYNIAIPKLEKMGVKTNVIRDERTYVSSFTRVIKRGKRIGQINSYPICGRCCIQRDCKLPPIKKWKASLAGEVVQYIGLAADEQERLMKDEVRGMVSLLDKYGITEADTFEICKRHELLSPIYEFTDRNGCWFCPNAKRKELRHLYDHHPDLWAKMLELERLPNKATELFNREERFSDIDFLFRMESDREQSKKTLDFLACRGDMGIQAEAKRLGVRKDTLFRWLERQGREMIPGQLSLLDDGFISEGASP